ncbi:hypothetical protein QJQ45_023308, partial [Haematococcus lacustris]
EELEELDVGQGPTEGQLAPGPAPGGSSADVASRAGASGSGQQDQGQGQGQAVKVVIAERRQVIKAALRSLVEAAQPDLSPAEVDAVVAEVNKRMTMSSKQCVLAAVLCLSVLLQSFLGGEWDEVGVTPLLPHGEGSGGFPGSGQLQPGWVEGGGGAGGVCKVVEQPSRPSADPRPDRLVIVDEFRTSRVSSSVHARQPCELHLPPNQPRPADWVPPAGQVNPRLVRPAWSLRHAKYVWGLSWCHQVPPNPPPPAPAQAPPPPAPAQDPPPTPCPGPPPHPLPRTPPHPQPRPHLPLPQPRPSPSPSPGPAPGPAPPPQAPPGGRWLDRDTNGCLNLQRIGESRQRPIELCRWDDLEALPPLARSTSKATSGSMTGCPKAGSGCTGLQSTGGALMVGPATMHKALVVSHRLSAFTKHIAVSFDEEPSGLSRESATRVCQANADRAFLLAVSVPVLVALGAVGYALRPLPKEELEEGKLFQDPDTG